MFRHMLEAECVAPQQLAYDRPSPKLIGFMAKHYNLSRFVPQTNNYVVFDQYFHGQPQQANRGKESVSSRPLTREKRQRRAQTDRPTEAGSAQRGQPHAPGGEHRAAAFRGAHNGSDENGGLGSSMLSAPWSAEQHTHAAKRHEHLPRSADLGSVGRQDGQQEIDYV